MGVSASFTLLSETHTVLAWTTRSAGRALATALRWRLDDPAQAAARGAYAKHHVERECTVEPMVARTLAVYREAVEG